jgi:transcriptional regulator with XRE-family HTH domain
MNHNKLLERMQELGLTQADLARRTGLSRGYIHLLLRGQRGSRIGADALQRLSTALDVAPTFFSSTSPHMENRVLRKD